MYKQYDIIWWGIKTVWLTCLFNFKTNSCKRSPYRKQFFVQCHLKRRAKRTWAEPKHHHSLARRRGQGEEEEAEQSSPTSSTARGVASEAHIMINIRMHRHAWHLPLAISRTICVRVSVCVCVQWVCGGCAIHNTNTNTWANTDTDTDTNVTICAYKFYAFPPHSQSLHPPLSLRVLLSFCLYLCFCLCLLPNLFVAFLRFLVAECN